MITAAIILATKPCADWTEDEEAIPNALAAIGDPTTWTAAIEALIANKWDAVSLPDARLTLCRHAAKHHRKILVGWMLDCSEWRLARSGKFEPDLRAIFADLRRWCAGEDVRLADVRDRAIVVRRAAYAYVAADAYAYAYVAAAADAYAYAYAAAAADAYAAAAAGAAADAAADAAAYAAADAALLDLARKVDAAEVPTC